MTTQTAQRQTSRAPKARPRTTPRPAPADPLAGLEVKDREWVEKVLRVRPTLARLLSEMKAEALRRFPECERLMLVPMGDSPRDFFMRVKTRAPDAYERLERFDAEWAHPRWKLINGRLKLTLIVP
jgi:hypothetical protein